MQGFKVYVKGLCLGFMSRILMHELMNTGALFSAAETLHSKGINPIQIHLQ
jgi:hypothetical protein